MATPAQTVWMTPAVLASLTQELADLTAPGRIPHDGDATRISQLRETIRRAEVGAKPDDGLVEPGMTITVRFEDDDTTATFLLGSRELVRLDAGVDLDIYSPTSPLGKAINGRYVGDRASYQTPNGTTVTLTITAAVPFG